KDGNLDFGRGDCTNIDAALSQRLECGGRDARMAAHPDADHRNLHQPGFGLDGVDADTVPGRFQHFECLFQVAVGYGERDVRLRTILRNVLDDHVHIDVRLG